MVSTPTPQHLGLGLLSTAGTLVVGVGAYASTSPGTGAPVGVVVLVAMSFVLGGLTLRSARALAFGHGALGAAVLLAQLGDPQNLVVAGSVGLVLLGLLEVASRAIESGPAIVWERDDRTARHRTALRIGGVAAASALVTSFAAMGGAHLRGPAMAAVATTALVLLGGSMVLLVRRVAGERR